MEKGTLWMVLGIAIAVAIVSAIVTSSITEKDVYTKKDIDSMIKKFATYEGVLDVLTDAQTVSPYITGGFLANEQTPNQYCQENGYGNCTLVLNTFRTIYYNSEDLNCNGGIKYIVTRNKLNGPANCNTLFNDAFYRVFDPRTIVDPNGAQCVTVGEEDSNYSDAHSVYSVDFVCAKA